MGEAEEDLPPKGRRSQSPVPRQTLKAEKFEKKKLAVREPRSGDEGVGKSTETSLENWSQLPRRFPITPLGREKTTRG